MQLSHSSPQTLPQLSFEALTFVLVGPPKTATTWLAHCLNQHPEVFCARENLFLTHARENNWENWRKQFAGRGAASVLGDYATTYSFTDGIAERLHQLNPNLRIVFTVRDPVERALSNYRHDLRTGFIPRRYPFHRLLDKYMLWNRYIGIGEYSRHVSHYLDSFPASQIYLFAMPEQDKHNQDGLNDLMNFMGIKPRPVAGASRVVYKSHNPLSPRLHYQAIHGSGRASTFARLVDPMNRGLGDRFLQDPIEPSYRSELQKIFSDIGERARLEQLVKTKDFGGDPRTEAWRE